MTVENTISKTGKQVMGAKTYDFSFDVLLKDPNEEDAKKAIKCSVSDGENEKSLVYGKDYSVVLNANRKGGRVTVVDPKDASWTIVVYRSYNETQESDYNDFDGFPAETLEGGLDKVTMILQDHQEQLDRCPKVNKTSDVDPQKLVMEVERIYDSIDNVDTAANNMSAILDAPNQANAAAGSAASAAASEANAKTSADSAAGSAVAAENSASAAAGSAASAAASEVSASNSAQSATAAKQAAEAAITDENLVIVATDLKSASSNIKSVAANKTNINTVAANKTNINTVAGDKANIDAVAANKANIDTVAENSAAVNNVASNMADVKSAVKSASDAKKWAVGTIAEQPDGSAKYWAEQAQSVTQVADASETAKGIARVATDAEVGAGTDDSTIVTPKKLKSKYASLAGAIFTGLLRIIKSDIVLDVRNTNYPTQNVLPENNAYSSITFNSGDGNYFTLIDTQMGTNGTSYARFIHKNPFKNKISKIESNVYSDGNNELKLSADAVTLDASKVTVPTVATNVKDKQAASTAWVNNWMVAQNPIGVTIATGNATSYTDLSLKTKDSSLDSVSNKTLTKTYYHDIVLDKNGKFIGYSQILQNGTTGKSRHAICARANKEDGTNVTATISVEVGQDEKIITYVPTPSENSNGTDIANTGWVTVFRYSINAISATSGSINLEVTRVYKMTVTDTTTFVLPTTPAADKHNQIKLMLKVTGTPTINWGTTNFFNKQTPEITEGYYDVYFDYDPNLAAWVCGVMAKGAEDNA